MSNIVSIIIPVYNVEKYLGRCLDSIITQTYTELEIILINDGSTDSCSQICTTYAAKDNRIKVYHQKNLGVAAARNVGLRYSTGDFIAFVDSDDILDKNFYKKMLKCLVDNKADIVECDFVTFKNELEIKYDLSGSKIEERSYTAEVVLELLMNEEIKQMPWNKLFTAQVARGIRFPVGKKHEDDFWAYQVFGNANKIVKRDEILYFYRQHYESNMGRPYNLSRLDGLLALEQRIQYMHTYFPNLENLATKKFCLGSLWHYQQIEKHPAIDPQKIYRRKIVENLMLYNSIFIFEKWQLKEIFWVLLFINAPIFCVRFRDFINIGT